MSYATIYDAATTNRVLKKQVAVALFQAAVNITNEARETPNHANRLFWARTVIADPVEWAEKAIWKVLENPTIAAAPLSATDNDVLFVVNSNIEAFVRM
jgi:hypothetical protein